MTSKCPIDINLLKQDLGEWAYSNQSTIVMALRQCMEWLPVSTISQYEKCLDAFPKEKPLIRTKH